MHTENQVAASAAQRREFATLRADVLSELVRLFAQRKEPMALAQAAADLVANAIGKMSGVFVYFWDPDAERLSLHTMTRMNYQENRIQMRLGEGVTGWSALHRMPVVVNGSYHEDPRFLDVEGVDEDEFRSVLAAPIYDNEALYGVFSMYSSNEHAFGEEELAIAEEVGVLLASGLKRAQTDHQLELQSATARFLIHLPSLSGISFPAAIRECTREILGLLDADACIIDSVGWLSMASEPTAVAERLGGQAQPKVWLTHSKLQARELEAGYENQGHDKISVSLGYGVSHGSLTCFRSRRFTREENDRLRMLASQVGVLIENIRIAPNRAAQIMGLLASDREDQMLDSLEYLGWKGNGFTPVLVQVKRVGTDFDTFGRIVQEAVVQEFGTETLLAQSGTLVILLAQGEQQSQPGAMHTKVTRWLERLEQTIGMNADVGIGESTIRANSIRNSLLQARAALAWASFSSTRKSTQVIDYDSVRAVRDLPRLVYDLRIGVQERCETLLPLRQYDQQHGTMLVETIEAFAFHGGSVVHAADALYVHRNTLRQRLSRIQSLINTDLSKESHWPEVLLAARLLSQEAL